MPVNNQLGDRHAGTVVYVERQNGWLFVTFESAGLPTEAFLLVAAASSFPCGIKAGDKGTIELRPGGPTGAYWAFLAPWPVDAVMIVAAIAGTELQQNMETVVHDVCRDCGSRIAADSRVIRESRNLPQRQGRPVKFFCLQCAEHFDIRECQAIRDYRPQGGAA